MAVISFVSWTQSCFRESITVIRCEVSIYNSKINLKLQNTKNNKFKVQKALTGRKSSDMASVDNLSEGSTKGTSISTGLPSSSIKRRTLSIWGLSSCPSLVNYKQASGVKQYKPFKNDKYNLTKYKLLAYPQLVTNSQSKIFPMDLIVSPINNKVPLWPTKWCRNPKINILHPSTDDLVNVKHHGL